MSWPSIVSSSSAVPYVTAASVPRKFDAKQTRISRFEDCFWRTALNCSHRDVEISENKLRKDFFVCRSNANCGQFIRFPLCYANINLHGMKKTSFVSNFTTHDTSRVHKDRPSESPLLTQLLEVHCLISLICIVQHLLTTATDKINASLLFWMNLITFFYFLTKFNVFFYKKSIQSRQRGVKLFL